MKIVLKFILLFFLIFPFDLQAISFQEGDLIKRQGMSAVYYYGSDKKRHAFPNETTYFSWYKDFSKVKIISSQELSNIPLGINITLRPGTRLVKNNSQTMVYALSMGGILNSIPNEQTAKNLFGSNWHKKVTVIPDIFWSNYVLGAALSNEHQEGSLIKYLNSSHVYLISGKTKRKIIDEKAFLNNQYKWEDIFTIPSFFIYNNGKDIIDKEYSLINLLVNKKETLKDYLNKIKYWAYFINFQNTEEDIDKIVASHYDLVVIDNERSLKGSENYPMSSKTAKIKDSYNSQGEKKIVLSYLNIGQAEKYRWYFQTGWKMGNPEWIEKEDPAWQGNYVVRFWHPEWQKIVYEYLDKIIADGFDGVYLDWVEAYEFDSLVKQAKKEEKNTESEMINFIKSIADYTRSKVPNFLIIPQNALSLGNSSLYLSAIDAIAQEHIWFDGSGSLSEPQGDCPLPAKETNIGSNEYLQSIPSYCRDEDLIQISSETYLKQLDNFKKAHKIIFVIDYALNKTNADKAYNLAKENGFIGYVTDRKLNQLSKIPPPGY